jgi:hypothetical protein
LLPNVPALASSKCGLCFVVFYWSHLQE